MIVIMVKYKIHINITINNDWKINEQKCSNKYQKYFCNFQIELEIPNIAAS